MKRLLAVMTVVAFALGVLAISGSAFATSSMMGDFTSAYPATAGTPLASCSTCHTSVPALNPYGSDVRTQGLMAIEALDSDGDGVNNLQEIRNLTNPGVAQAAPTATTTPSTTTTTAATSTTASTVPASPTTSTTIAPTRGATTTTTTPATGRGPADEPSPSGEAVPFNIGGVGTVWLVVEDGRLLIVEVATDWTYTQEIEEDEVEIEFRAGDKEVEFEAELEHGVISTEVEREIDHDDDRDDDDHDDHDDHDHDDHDHDDDDDD